MMKIAVLVVDDCSFCRAMLKSLLLAMGCTVVVAENPQEALASLGEREFDIVLSDYEMPAMSGTELHAEMKRLLSRQPEFHIISGADAIPARDSEEMKGIRSWLKKPVDHWRIRSLISVKLAEIRALRRLPEQTA